MSLPAETEALEHLIASKTDKAAVVQQLLRTVIVVPVDIQEGDSGGIAPVTVTVDGRSSVVSFTRAEGAEEIKDRTPHVFTMPATGLILRIPDGLSLLLFTPVGNVDFDAQLLADIRADLRERATSDGSAD